MEMEFHLQNECVLNVQTNEYCNTACSLNMMSCWISEIDIFNCFVLCRNN